jgi:hypothetical protein
MVGLFSNVVEIEFSEVLYEKIAPAAKRFTTPDALYGPTVEKATEMQKHPVCHHAS